MWQYSSRFSEREAMAARELQKALDTMVDSESSEKKDAKRS